MSVSAIEADLQTDGRHEGALTVALPEGMLRVPILVLRNGEGPQTLLTAGIHGDEYEGPIALRHLMRDLDWRKIRGQIVICPVINIRALAADTRRAPDDDMDLNRAFPGNPNGSYTQRLADAVARQLVPIADQVIDLHTGGPASSYIPSAMIHPVPDAQVMQRSLDLVRGMRAPAGIVIDESDKNGTMFDDFVEAAGKSFVSCEFGGTLTSPETIAIARQSVLNGLIKLGHVEGEPETPIWRGERIARMLETPSLEYQCIATATGLFEPLKETAEIVSEGEPLALIHALDSPRQAPVEVIAPKNGVLFYRSTLGVIKKGEEVAMLARQWAET